MTPVSAVREAMALSRPDVCHLIDPHRLGLKVAEAADRLGVPTVVLDPRRWKPGVDLDDHHPGLRDQKLHDRWARVNSLDGDRLVVGYVGRPRSHEGAQPARRHGAGCPACGWWSLGDGRGAEMLRTAGAKVLPHVTGLERARCLASFDVLLQPRKKEVYAPTVHEALASGVPVIAYDGGTAADVVRHEHNGLLVDTDRGVKTFAGAVARLAANRELLAALAELARGSVADRTWDDAVDELLDVHYPDAVGRPSAAIG